MRRWCHESTIITEERKSRFARTEKKDTNSELLAQRRGDLTAPQVSVQRSGWRFVDQRKKGWGLAASTYGIGGDEEGCVGSLLRVQRRVVHDLLLGQGQGLREERGK